MSDLAQAIIGGIAVQILLTIVTVAILKTDSKWIKRAVTDHENRIRKMEHGDRKSVDMTGDSGKWLGIG